MIKFFRKSRENLVSEGKTGKYFKYAVGEITLVVIGILIALGINSWNQDRLNDKRELDLLRNLNEELYSNISLLKEIDSVFDKKAKECSQAMELLKHPLDLDKFLKINSLVTTRWAVFRVNRNTYDEMLNSGSFYSLNNNKLQEDIRSHYTKANNYVKTFQEINENGQDITHSNEELFVIELIEDWVAEENNSLKDIDTSWINNPNSLTYQTFYKKAKFYTSTNILRKNRIEQFMESCQALSGKIEIELKNPTR